MNSYLPVEGDRAFTAEELLQNGIYVETNKG